LRVRTRLSQRVMGAAPIDAIVSDELKPAQSSIRLIESISAGNTLREGNQRESFTMSWRDMLVAKFASIYRICWSNEVIEWLGREKSERKVSPLELKCGIESGDVFSIISSCISPLHK